MEGLLRNDPKALAAPALSMYWWYPAAAIAPRNGPAQKIHCFVLPIKKKKDYLLRKASRETNKFMIILIILI